MSLAAKLERYSIPEPNSGCLLWTGTVTRHGYGSLRWGGGMRRAHRLVWSLAHGPVPAGLVVMHKCDVPACINLNHLIIGTQSDNLADARRKGRMPQASVGGAKATTKLSNADVIAIRAASKSARQLAEEYGVSARHVRQILAGQKRTSVTAFDS